MDEDLADDDALYGDEYLDALLSDAYGYEESDDLIDEYMDLYDSLLDEKANDMLDDDETISSLTELEDLLDEYDDVQTLMESDDQMATDAYIAALLAEEQANDNLYSSAAAIEAEDADDFVTNYENLYDEQIEDDYYAYDDDEAYSDLYAAEQEDEWSNANNLLDQMYRYEAEYDNVYDEDVYDDYDDEEEEEEESAFVAVNGDVTMNNLPNNAWVWQLLILSFSLGVCSCLCYYATKVNPSRRGSYDFEHNKKGNYSKVSFESANSAYDHSDVIDQQSDIELIEQ